MIRKACDSGATGTDTFNAQELHKQCGAYLVEWSLRDFGNVTGLLKEKMWQLRSRLTWLKHGDQRFNTKFFRAYAPPKGKRKNWIKKSKTDIQ